MVVNLVFILISMKITKKYPRKFLLILGISIMGLCLFCFWLFGALGPSTASISKYLILVFMAAYSISIGPVAWVLFTELVPDVGFGLIIFSNWCIAMLIGQMFPVLVSIIGLGQSLLLVSLFSLVAVVGIKSLVIETLGKSPEEIAELYSEEKANGFGSMTEMKIMESKDADIIALEDENSIDRY